MEFSSSESEFKDKDSSEEGKECNFYSFDESFDECSWTEMLIF